jgi:hypothetical protein
VVKNDGLLAREPAAPYRFVVPFLFMVTLMAIQQWRGLPGNLEKYPIFSRAKTNVPV